MSNAEWPIVVSESVGESKVSGCRPVLQDQEKVQIGRFVLSLAGTASSQEQQVR